MAKIELSHVCYDYQAHGRSFRALDDVNLQVEEGEFVCLIGRSGCGKTTLLRLLAGLAQPATGTVRIDGTPVQGPGTDRAMVFQSYTLFPWMTARKNVQFGIRQANRRLSRAQVRALADEYLHKVELSDAADKYPCELSGGMCQRVAIARALAMDAELLLLDEPFGALDAKTRGQLQRLLRELWCQGGRRKTVIFVTHDIPEAAQLATRVVFMTPGHIGAEFPVGLPCPRSDGGGTQLEALTQRLLQLFEQEEADDETGA